MSTTGRKKKDLSGEYLGILYESDEEKHFLFWVELLMLSGHILRVERGNTFSLTEGLVNEYSIEMPRKGTIIKRQQLLRPSVYTPDYKIYWNPKRHRKFVWTLDYDSKCDKLIGHTDVDGNLYTLIECKSDFDRNNMTRLFISNQKFTWTMHDQYVNLCKIPELFAKTFTPPKYLYTSTGKPRKINFEVRTLKQYLTS